MKRLVTWGVASAFGFFFKEILEELAREDLEKYTKTFFKDAVQDWLGIRHQEILEIAFGQALKEFLQLMQVELEDADCSDAELKKYTNSLRQFIHNPTVQVELGKLFQDAVSDPGKLAQIWQELQLQPLPDFFDWQRIIKRYRRKIKAIQLESDELRSVLDKQNLQANQQNIEKLAEVPDFDLMRYRAAIEKAYSYLRLDTFDTSGYSYNLKLWKMFVAQNVREVNEALPQIYELPIEHRERLKKSGQLEELEISPETLEHYKRTYALASSRSILELIDDRQTYQHIVILGDPGSGKSSLVQYLTLQWAESPIQHLPFLPIPLLIELRTYVRSRDRQECQNFLEFFQQGSSFICPLNQQQLDALLRTGKAFVMFDGLDEVFEPKKREEAITDIINFTQKYPQVRVLVTSRVIGYKPQRLRDAKFRHFMLQELEPEQIQEFINRWHDLAFTDPFDKVRKRERLQQAIEDSPAIRQLAGNPLLLTMMAILNRNQDLPRDRPELYSQASRVLLQQWDVEKALMHVDYPIIDYKDKQAMLRQVAYHMQANEKGLAGNLINADDLENILTNYLQNVEESAANTIARLMINQLRERNFILCFLGADYYAFVHRTFLEYFCAWEFVWQFEKERSISLEYLKTQVFGKHWQDESWHEVLRLIAGMIDAKFVGEIIDYLIEQNNSAKEKFTNLLLAADCLFEVRNRTAIAPTAVRLLEHLKDVAKKELSSGTAVKVFAAIATNWKDDPETLPWLKTCIRFNRSSFVSESAVQAIAQGWKDEPDTLPMLKQLATSHEHWVVRRAAVQAIAQGWKDEPDTLPMLKQLATSDEEEYVRRAAMEELAQGWKDEPDTLPMLKQLATSDEKEYVRRAAVEELAQGWKDEPDTFEFLCDRAINDPFERQGDLQINPRQTALRVIIKQYPSHPQTLTLLRDRAENDPDKQVRKFAQKKLADLKN